ncbi:MAG: hypothetical protein ACLUOI_38230 [Eisenbergiella sp.]
MDIGRFTILTTLGPSAESGISIPGSLGLSPVRIAGYMKEYALVGRS